MGIPMIGLLYFNTDIETSFRLSKKISLNINLELK